MAVRLAVFECPCCQGQASMPLAPRRRAPALRPCANGGCWDCLGACQGMARRVEVMRVPRQGPPAATESAPPGSEVLSFVRAPSRLPSEPFVPTTPVTAAFI